MRSVFLLFISLFSINLCAAPQIVKILTDNNYRPYSYAEDGKAVGLYPDMVKAVSEAMPDFQIEVIPINWVQGKAQIQDGKSLGLLTVYLHGHHWPFMYPYSFPINKEEIITVCNDNKPIATDAQWPSDYTGRLVAHVAGYDGWLGYQVRSKKYTSHVNLIEVPNTDIALKMVVKGGADCALFERVAFKFSLDFLISNGDFSEKTDTTPRIVSDIGNEYIYIGYSEKALASGDFPFADNFRKAFDMTLYKMQKQGSFDYLYEKYLNQSNSLPAKKRFQNAEAN